MWSSTSVTFTFYGCRLHMSPYAYTIYRHSRMSLIVLVNVVLKRTVVDNDWLCVAKMSVTFWTRLFKFLVLLLKIGVTYDDKLSRNVKNNGKNLKNFFLTQDVLMSCFIWNINCSSVSQKLNLNSCGRKSLSNRPSCLLTIVFGKNNEDRIPPLLFFSIRP